jgi:hypothetical protein
MIDATRHIARLALLVLVVVACSCAFNLSDVTYRPSRIEVVGSEGAPFTLAADAEIRGAPCGYSRTLRKGTRWNPVGTLAEGIVYKSPDQALTIECSNVYEVYLVVARLRLVGFYLPVEKGFSPLGEPIQLVAFGQP